MSLGWGRKHGHQMFSFGESRKFIHTVLEWACRCVSHCVWEKACVKSVCFCFMWPHSSEVPCFIDSILLPCWHDYGRTKSLYILFLSPLPNFFSLTHPLIHTERHETVLLGKSEDKNSLCVRFGLAWRDDSTIKGEAHNQKYMSAVNFLEIFSYSKWVSNISLHKLYVVWLATLQPHP